MQCFESGSAFKRESKEAGMKETRKWESLPDRTEHGQEQRKGAEVAKKISSGSKKN
jgi:hypothetical protein